MAAVAALIATLVTGSGPATAAPAGDASSTPATACTAAPAPAPAASVDYFLRLDGIPGESTDDQHAGEIDIASFQWGVNLEGTACSTARQRPTISGISIAKNLDRASPKLMQAAATGTHIATATLTARRAGGPAGQEFLVITLQQVVVSGYALDAGAGTFPQDTFTLAFATIKVEYTPQNADGTAGTPVTFCFDTRADRAC